MPTRIAQLIQSVDAPSGGTSTAFLQLMAALGTRPDAVSVRAYTTRPPAEDPAAAVVAREPDRWTVADGTGVFGPGQLGRAVIRDIRRGAVDLLHLHGVWSPDLVGAARAARRAGVPYVWQPHGMLLGHALAQKALKKQAFLRLGLGRALREADGFIYCTAGEREESMLPRGLPAGRRHVVYLPVSIPEDASHIPEWRRLGRARWGLDPAARVVAFLGRVHPVKRLELAFRALARARAQDARVRLAIFGAGDEAYTASLRRLAGQLGIAGAVTFAGWIGGEDKWVALVSADVLVLNSLHENFGYTVLEALGVGTPVLMTENLAIAPDILEASQAAPAPFATAVSPTAEALAGAMVELTRFPLSPEAACAARGWVKRTFSQRAVADQLVHLYERIVQCKPAVQGVTIPAPS